MTEARREDAASGQGPRHRSQHQSDQEAERTPDGGADQSEVDNRGIPARAAQRIGERQAPERFAAAMDSYASQIDALAPWQFDAFIKSINDNEGKYSDRIVVATALTSAQRTREPRSKKGNGQAAPHEDSAPPELPQVATALELMELDMSPIAYLRDPWIGEGLTIMAGRPKLGKTTLLRQKLAAVAGGKPMFGAGGPQATAAFLCLEEGDRLARKKFDAAGFDDATLANILIYFTWRRGKDGVLDLHRMLDKFPNVRYVGIDSLTRFRDIPDARAPAFSCDYEAVSSLHAVAKARPGLAIEVVHHTRKAKSDDPLDDISGTYGVSAAVDSFWVLRHHEDGAVLHIGGRLWENDATQFQLRRGRQVWELAGEFTGASTTQIETLDVLRKSKGMTPTEAASAFNIKVQSAFDRLSRLVSAGLAYSKGGRYFAKS